MTDLMPDQTPPPAPLGPVPPLDAAAARRCKRPGCDTALPAATGRGAPRLFCSPACSRKWHNDNRPTAGAAAGQQAAAPGRVAATLAAAEAARGQAQAETAVALARAAQATQAAQAATAAMHAAWQDAQAALEAADQARADADAAA